MNIFVAGSGAWGTALAMLLVDNHHTVTLWTRTAEKAAARAASLLMNVWAAQDRRCGPVNNPC